jgi:hypothetical protein
LTRGQNGWDDNARLKQYRRAYLEPSAIPGSGGGGITAPVTIARLLRYHCDRRASPLMIDAGRDRCVDESLRAGLVNATRASLQRT